MYTGDKCRGSKWIVPKIKKWQLCSFSVVGKRGVLIRRVSRLTDCQNSWGLIGLAAADTASGEFAIRMT